MFRADEDQMPRLRRFRKEHPEITIIGPAGILFWSANQDGKSLGVNYDLDGLLNRLNGLLASRGDAE